MEIPASFFFGYGSMVGALSLYLGFNALNNTDLPASLPPTVLFLFKHFLAIAFSHSSTRTLVFHTNLRIHVLNYCALLFLAVSPFTFLTITGVAFKIYSLVNAFVLIYYFLPWTKRVLGDEFFYITSVGIALFPLPFVLMAPAQTEDINMLCWFVSIFNYTVILQPCYAVVDLEQFCLHFHFMAMFILLITTQLSPILVLFPAFLTCIAEAAVSGDERFRRWLPAEQNRVLSEVKRFMRKNGSVIEFSVGMAGTVLFQYFFRLTTFDHVVAFLFFAVAWLANLAQISCPRDLGVFNFFLSNVIVGCTVSQFGVGRTTWLAYAASSLLYILRVKLELICVVTRDGKEAVVAWRQNQTEETNQII